MSRQFNFRFETLDEWKNSVDELLAVFLPYCHKRFEEAGIELHVNHQALIDCHSDWIVYCDEWIKSDMLPQDKEDLSHIKKLSVLLYYMVKHRVVTVYSRDHNVIVIGKKHNEKMYKKLVSGDTTYICVLFIYNMMENYEKYRDDKEDVYISRINEEFEKDLIVRMLSEKLSPKTLHVIFKALFLRD